MKKAIAVCLSDIHYDLPSLELADKATNMAIDTANELEVALVITGDLHDTKAALRGECVNRMIETFQRCVFKPYILTGNHDRLHEKSVEHSLNFLRPYASIIDRPIDSHLGYFIPYCSDKDEFTRVVSTVYKLSRLIVHQGVLGANMGEYIQDKSAVPKEVFAGRRVISGHYHARQDIVCPDGGLFSYVGNPYTRTFGEANDPPKGYQILYDDDSLEFVPTNLRKHIIYDITASEVHTNGFTRHFGEDLVWLKIRGTNEELRKIRDSIMSTGWRVDFIPTDSKQTSSKADEKSQAELLDSFIDSCDSSDEQKARLKQLWRKLASN